MDNLRAEILQLERELDAKKKLLFIHRFNTIISIYQNAGETGTNLTKISINTDEESDTWHITYIHKTKQYNSADYLYEQSDTADAADGDISDDEPISKTSKISFGVNITSSGLKKYFIKGGAPLDSYKTSTNELRIINLEYQFDIDYDEQKELITSYANNVNLPEYAAIRFMLYISDNEWDDTAIINHFTMI
jgi:hypothetical protein